MITTTTTTTLLAAVCLLCLQDPKPDEAAAKRRLGSAVKATGLQYETSPSGLSFVLLFTDADRREQKVYVAQAPSTVSRLTMHTIYTTVWADAQKPPDEAIMRKVFAHTKKLGSYWLYTDGKGAWSIRFGLQFDATDLPAESKPGDALVQTLADLIRFVQRVGADTDKDLNGDRDVK